MTAPIVQAIRHYSRRLVRELGFLNEECIPLSISHTECHTLIELEQSGLLTVGELADRLRLDKSTMSRAVQSMQDEGLIEPLEDDSDKRRKPYRLTTRGKKQVAEIHMFANGQIDQVLSLLSEEQQEIVKGGLALYANALSRQRAKSLFQIAALEKEDDAGIAKVIQTVMPEFGCCGPGFAMHDPEVSAMYSSYRGKDRGFFVVRRDSRVLGGAGFAPLEGGKKAQCELRKMYLLPEARGYGLGDELLERCLCEARKAGYSYCYLETTSRMLQARRLYEKFGFEELDGPMGETGHFSCDKWYGKSL